MLTCPVKLLQPLQPHRSEDSVGICRAALTRHARGQTGIRESVITAIEGDDYSACGGDSYVRGYIRSIAGVCPASGWKAGSGSGRQAGLKTTQWQICPNANRAARAKDARNCPFRPLCSDYVRLTSKGHLGDYTERFKTVTAGRSSGISYINLAWLRVLHHDCASADDAILGQ